MELDEMKNTVLSGIIGIIEIPKIQQKMCFRYDKTKRTFRSTTQRNQTAFKARLRIMPRVRTIRGSV